MLAAAAGIVAACNALNGSDDLAFGPSAQADAGAAEAQARDAAGQTSTDAGSTAPLDSGGSSGCPRCSGGAQCCKPEVCRSDGTCGPCSEAQCAGPADCCAGKSCGQAGRCVKSCIGADASCTFGTTSCCFGLTCQIDLATGTAAPRCAACKTKGTKCLEDTECCTGKCDPAAGCL